jgi:hypothetical protein
MSRGFLTALSLWPCQATAWTINGQVVSRKQPFLRVGVSLRETSTHHLEPARDQRMQEPGRERLGLVGRPLPEAALVMRISIQVQALDSGGPPMCPLQVGSH